MIALPTQNALRAMSPEVRRETLADLYDQADALHELALDHRQRGDVVRARALMLEALRVWRFIERQDISAAQRSAVQEAIAAASNYLTTMEPGVSLSASNPWMLVVGGLALVSVAGAGWLLFKGAR